MTKPKTKTALVATSSVSLASLADAGITDFKLNKEDLIDLLVDEAVRTVEEELASLNTLVDEANKAVTEEAVQASKDLLAFLIATPAGKALCKMYPQHTPSFSHNNYTGCPCLKLTPPEGYKSPENDAGFPLLFLTVPKTLVEASESRGPAAEKLSKLNSQHHAIACKLSNIKHSTKSLRTQLVRKILANNTAGKAVLENVRDLSAAFVASLEKK